MTHFVHIPLRAYDEVIQIPINDLPLNSNDIIRVLTKEESSIDVWIQTAAGYYNINRIDDAIKILDTILQSTPPKNRDKTKIYNAKAALYSQKAYYTTDRNQKKNLAEQATLAIQESEKIDNYNHSTWLGKGVYHLLIDLDIEKANAQFDYIFDRKPSKLLLTPALIGKGIVYFHRKQYSLALDSFREAVQKNPLCLPELRNAFGLCYVKLGRKTLAKKWFERVLELNPNNVDALLGLAVISFNSNNLKDRKKIGYKYILQAFSINPNHPRVLNYIARYYFHKKQYSNAEKYAAIALGNALSSNVKAESLYIQGRIYQARKNFDMAVRKFEAVLRICNDHILARHGLAQMNIYLGDIKSAISNLEKLLKLSDSAEISKLLGCLHAKIGNKKEAIKLLDKVVIQIPQDWEAWIELAQLKESTKCSNSLDAYESAINSLKLDLCKLNKCNLKDAETYIPAELWNNVGAMRHRIGNYKMAEIAYLNSIEASKYPINDFRIENITTTYNIARLYEDTFRSRDAIVLYSRILKEHPNIIECYLRLSCISASRKQNEEAIKWIRCAFEIDINNIDAWTLSGNLFFKEREWQKAQQKYEHILESPNKKDNYTTLALANIYFYAKNDSKITKERSSKFIKTASDFYRKVLSSQGNNLSAICGIGCILATKGHINDAQQCFIQVRENSTNSILSINSWVNLAHVLVKLGRFSSAAQLYIKTLEKYKFNCNSEILLYLANCYFLSSQLLDCKRTLLNAIHINPINTTLWYNLAITQNKYAVIISRKKKNASIQETNQAIIEANQAIKIFSRLIEKAKDPTFKRKYSSSTCKDEKLYSEKLVDGLYKLLNDLKKLEEENTKISEQTRLRVDNARKLLQSEEEKIIKKKLEYKEKIAEEAKIVREQQAELTKQWAETKKRKRNDDFIEDEPPSKKKKTQKQPQIESDDDSENQISSLNPIEYQDETIEEMRNRRGGHLAILEETIENESKARRQKEIDNITEKFNALDEEMGETLTDIQKLIKQHLEEELPTFSSETLQGFKFGNIGKILVKKGIRKKIVKQNKDFVTNIAKDIISDTVN